MAVGCSSVRYRVFSTPHVPVGIATFGFSAALTGVTWWRGR